MAMYPTYPPPPLIRSHLTIALRVLATLSLRPIALRVLAARNRAVVLVKAPTSSDGLMASIVEAWRRHETGEPLLASKLIVSVLIVRKLKARHYWGGKAKEYLWASDLAKGRGVDERFADIAPEVANDLFLSGILIKKTSQGQPKYALDPERKSEVHDIADQATFRNKQLERVLMRDQQQEGASYLHKHQETQGFTLIQDGVQPLRCGTAAEAMRHVAAYQDEIRCEEIVHFENDRILRDVFEYKRILVQFLEAFV